MDNHARDKVFPLAIILEPLVKMLFPLAVLLTQPPVDMQFPPAVGFLYLAASGSFPAFFQFFKTKLLFIYIYTQIYIY
jgi:hypothetical protein